MTEKGGWRWFWLWAIPGFVLGFQVSQIGPLLLPIGIVAAIYLSVRSRGWPELLGLAAGIGLTCLLIAMLAVFNSDSPLNCPASGEIVTRTANSVHTAGCHRWLFLPWLVVGAVFTGGSAFAYGLLARTHGRFQSVRSAPG